MEKLFAEGPSRFTAEKLSSCLKKIPYALRLQFSVFDITDTYDGSENPLYFVSRGRTDKYDGLEKHWMGLHIQVLFYYNLKLCDHYYTIRC